MSASQKTAVLQEALDGRFQWRQFIAQKLALIDKPVRNVIADGTPAVTDSSNTSTTTTSTDTSATSDTTQQPGGLSPLAKGALLIVSLLAAGGTGYGITKLLQPAVVTPPAVTQPNQATGDLLNELHKQGYNLPPITTPK